MPNWIMNVTQNYEYLMKANEEAAEQLIPKKIRLQKKKESVDPRDIQARKRVKVAFSTYQETHQI